MKVGDEAQLFSHFLFALIVSDNTIWAMPLYPLFTTAFSETLFFFFCTLAEINQQKHKLPTMECSDCYKTFESFSANVSKVGSISIMGSSMEADFINAFNTMPI